jgi:hypothetical protein
MSPPRPPATSLHDVVVMNEQTRAEWRAGRASIEAGLIVIASSPQAAPPPGLLERLGATFTLVAIDGADRLRRFPHVVYTQAESAPPGKFVFR